MQILIIIIMIMMGYWTALFPIIMNENYGYEFLWFTDVFIYIYVIDIWYLIFYLVGEGGGCVC